MTVAFFDTLATSHESPPLRVTSTTGLPVLEVPTAVQVVAELHDTRIGEASWAGGSPRDRHEADVLFTVASPPDGVRAIPTQVEVPAQPTLTRVPAAG
jgi:hypothetical protein